MDNKDRPEEKREKMRQEELKNPSSSIHGSNLSNLTGKLGWKSTGFIIIALILLLVIFVLFFS